MTIRQDCSKSLRPNLELRSDEYEFFMLKSTTQFRLVNSKAGISNHEKCISSKNCYLENGGGAIT